MGKLEFKDTLRQLEREPRRPHRRGRQIGGSREYLGPPNSSASGSYGGSRDFLNTSGGGGGSGSRDYLGPPTSRKIYLIIILINLYRIFWVVYVNCILHLAF